jgi:hypothetical protein
MESFSPYRVHIMGNCPALMTSTEKFMSFTNHIHPVNIDITSSFPLLPFLVRFN